MGGAKGRVGVTAHPGEQPVVEVAVGGGPAEAVAGGGPGISRKYCGGGRYGKRLAAAASPYSCS